MGAAEKFKVVLVDHNASMRAVLRSILKAEGYSVVGEASDGAAALAAIARLKPEVVTLDLELSGPSGLEVLDDIRKTYPETHVVAVNGTNNQAQMQDAFSKGAVGYVTKPFSTGGVLKVFEKLTGGPSGRAVRATSAKRCVIIDGNPGVRKQLREILVDAGVIVAGEAETGQEGLEALERELPDLVFLDVDMPVLDGLEALTCLRAVHPNLPVIMISARADRETITRVAEKRVSALLLQPFESKKVIEALKKAGI